MKLAGPVFDVAYHGGPRPHFWMSERTWVAALKSDRVVVPGTLPLAGEPVGTFDGTPVYLFPLCPCNTKDPKR